MDQSVPERRGPRRIWILWVALSGLLLALLMGAGWLAFTVRQTRRAVAEAREQITDVPVVFRPIIRKLGGPEHAAGKLALYLRLPDRLAPDKGHACKLLEHCGPAARKALPILLRLLDGLDDDGGMALRALEVLNRLGPEARPAVPALVRILGRDDLKGKRRGDPDWTRLAAYTLGRIGPGAAEAVPGLRKALANQGARLDAILALGLVGPAARDAAPELEALLKSGDVEERADAALALWRIDGNARRSLAVLLERLKRDSAWTSWRAAEALGEMGPAAQPALAKLRAIAKGKARSLGDWLRAVFVAEAIWRISGETREAVPVLVAALDDSDWNVRSLALDALTRMGPAAVEAAPAIERHLNDEWCLYSAREALYQIRGEAPEK